ncbi:MAG: transcription termination/antitermination protein NusG [Gammaproteobacteria bacterium]|nr:transcription termination/antitermination protein NusG [Gammaproteobacteria bacterium]
MKWYVVGAYSGHEKNIADTLRDRIENSEEKDEFGEVLVPTEEVVEMRGGRKRQTERRFYPGYIFVQMRPSAATTLLVRTTPRVTGFIGTKQHADSPNGREFLPSPLSDADAREVLDRVEKGSDSIIHKIVYEPGELVRVIDGPFNDFSGTVEKVDYEKSRLTVAVSIFNRSTPVDLEFSQVEKG